MISTLTNIERCRFDHDKNKLFICSIFFPMKFFTFYAIMTKINLQRLYWIAYQNGIFYLIFTVF